MAIMRMQTSPRLLESMKVLTNDSGCTPVTLILLVLDRNDDTLYFRIPAHTRHNAITLQIMVSLTEALTTRMVELGGADMIDYLKSSLPSGLQLTKPEHVFELPEEVLDTAEKELVYREALGNEKQRWLVMKHHAVELVQRTYRVVTDWRVTAAQVYYATASAATVSLILMVGFQSVKVSADGQPKVFHNRAHVASVNPPIGQSVQAGWPSQSTRRHTVRKHRMREKIQSTTGEAPRNFRAFQTAPPPEPLFLTAVPIFRPSSELAPTQLPAIVMGALEVAPRPTRGRRILQAITYPFAKFGRLFP
jgi:hypothetical protein